MRDSIEHGDWFTPPTTHHLPVSQWWTPADFDEWKRIGEELGITHVESSPLTRSSHHAQAAADASESARPATAAPSTIA
jgi:lipoic acid synthetase